MLKILARQNKQLAQLATDSDTVLAPLAKVRRQIAGFSSRRTRPRSRAPPAQRDISRSFQLFPEFLRQLRPLLVASASSPTRGRR